AGRSRPRSRSGSSTLPATRSHGNSAGSWNISATRRPPVSIRPLVTGSSPATSDSSVLLPQPEAPSRHTNSPSATSSENRSSATREAAARPYTLLTASIRTAAGAGGAVPAGSTGPVPAGSTGPVPGGGTGPASAGGTGAAPAGLMPPHRSPVPAPARRAGR